MMYIFDFPSSAGIQLLLIMNMYVFRINIVYKYMYSGEYSFSAAVLARLKCISTSILCIVNVVRQVLEGKKERVQQLINCSQIYAALLP